MEEKRSKTLYEKAILDVVYLSNKDVIATSGESNAPTSSGGELDSNWDVN